MEKKIDKKFFLLSSFNIVPALILGRGLTVESLILVCALIVLVINHLFLVMIVKSVTDSSRDGDSSRHLVRILMFMFIKIALLFGIVVIIYLLNKELVPKLFLIIFFQLIIQIVSIKNNYQNS